MRQRLTGGLETIRSSSRPSWARLGSGTCRRHGDGEYGAVLSKMSISLDSIGGMSSIYDGGRINRSVAQLISD
ncbi:MAG: hypothetical protein EBZ36_10120 [Acidobacteria bacterium]|nr:hypothetical protein [Acidobacteriota bacterium]